jgi:hypothetical protein
MAADSPDFSQLNYTSRELADRLDEVNKRLSGLNNQSSVLASSMNNLGRSMSSFGAGVDTAGREFSSGIRAFRDGVGGLSKTLDKLGTVAGFAADNADQLGGSFRRLSDVGALAGQGLTGLANDFAKSGLSFQGYTRLVAENATALSMFKGTAGKGAQAFAELTGSVIANDKANGDGLRALGFSTEQMGEATANYIKMQAQAGTLQGKTNEQLAKCAKDYMLQLDELSRVTGMSRSQIQKQQEAQMNDARFAATIDKLRAEGREKEAQEIQNIGIQFEKFGDPSLSKGIKDLASGFTQSAEAQQVFASTGGRSTEIMERLRTGQIDSIQAQKEFKEAFAANAANQRDYAATVGEGERQFVNYATLRKVTGQAEVQSREEIVKEQQAAADKLKKGQDDATKAFVEAGKSLETMNRSITGLAFTGLPALNTAIYNATQSFNTVARGGAAATGLAGTQINVPTTGTPQPGLTRGPAPAAPVAAAATAAPSAPTGDVQQRLSALNTKPGAGTTNNERLIALAEAIQKEYPDARFTAFNDVFHQRERPNSAHTKNRAVDFSFTDRDRYPTTPEFAAKVVEFAKGLGFSNVIDEYSQNRGGTGPHFHAEISARNGFSGLLSGPTSGYRPNLTMHGDERLSITPKKDFIDYNTMAEFLKNGGNSDMMPLLDEIRELVTVTKNSLGVQEKILRSSY